MLPGLLFLCCLTLAADVEPPLVGRPENFSGAIGVYKISMEATPTEVEVEQSITLTVRITGSAGLQGVKRPDLRRLPRFAQRFNVQNLGERQPTKEIQEYDYRLRPLSIEVTEIPSLPFVYFKPGVIPDYKGYQTSSAAALPIKVRPTASASSKGVPVQSALADENARQLFAALLELRHHPGDAEAAAHLRQLRQLLGQSESNTLPLPLALNPWVGLYGVCGGALLGSLLARVGHQILRRRGLSTSFRTIFWFAELIAIPLVLIPLGLQERSKRELLARPFVIVQREVVLRGGNGELYPPRGEAPLKPGQEAWLLFRRGNWLQVELPDDTTGWLPDGAVLGAP